MVEQRIELRAICQSFAALRAVLRSGILASGSNAGIIRAIFL